MLNGHNVHNGVKMHYFLLQSTLAWLQWLIFPDTPWQQIQHPVLLLHVFWTL